MPGRVASRARGIRMHNMRRGCTSFRFHRRIRADCGRQWVCRGDQNSRMTRAVSDSGWAFGDSNLLGGPDCGSRHPLGSLRRVANCRNFQRSRGQMERRRGNTRARGRHRVRVRVRGVNDGTWWLRSSRAVKVDRMDLNITITELVLLGKSELD